MKVALAARIGPLMFRALAATWRVRRVGDTEPGKDGKKRTFAVWHESILTAVGLHRGRDVTLLVSTHHDGELITRVVEGLGYRTARGSSTRGGSRAIRELLRSARDASGLSVTPDGPRGPAYSIAPGVIYVSGATGLPLVAAGFATSRAWRTRSWDRMIVPKPFARVVVVYSEELEVSRQAALDEAQLAEHAELLRDHFEHAHEIALETLRTWKRGSSGD